MGDMLASTPSNSAAKMQSLRVPRSVAWLKSASVYDDLSRTVLLMSYPRKILLVDDEQYVTSLVAAKLRALGDEVTTAGDGEEALPLATSLLPDLIVSDLQMPIMTGFELACQLKKQPATAEIPVILLTGRGHLVDAGEMSQTNIRQLLGKPFSAKELVAKIEELIGPPRQGERPVAV